ncbi:MAG: DegQ family serine endoprotease [Alphaproteobacteria bacterium]|nr:DegQ family serine endoprotease [Alphaproteobacteria bacterium]
MRFALALFSVCLVLASAPLQAEELPETPTSVPAVTAPGTHAPESFADLAASLSPAVVNISSTQKTEALENLPDMPHFPPGSPFEDFFEDFMDRHGGPNGMPATPPTSLGSGFIIDGTNGYIVTNNHVIEDADEVRVTFSDDSTREATLVGRDEKTDIAVLQVETDTPLPAVPFGNSDHLRVGDWVLAIGNPFGLGGTVTAGIVSARQRNIHAGPYDDFIQTDASINRGNSGGPMFNLAGEVIGINTAIYSPSGGSVGIGFAIPSSLAEPVIRQLISFGHTRRGWMGVRIQAVTDEIADSLGLTESQGALIASVTKDGPADKAGLVAGDIILSFDAQTISEMRTLPRIVAETPIGKEARVEYWRNGKKAQATVTIGELEKAEESGLLDAAARKTESETGLTIEQVGMTLGTLSDSARAEYDISKTVEGVLILKIDPQSEAAEKGLLPGDVILEINQKAVTTPVAAGEIIRKAEKSGRSSLLLLVDRDGDVRFVALKLAKK